MRGSTVAVAVARATVQEFPMWRVFFTSSKYRFIHLRPLDRGNFSKLPTPSKTSDGLLFGHMSRQPRNLNGLDPGGPPSQPSSIRLAAQPALLGFLFHCSHR